MSQETGKWLNTNTLIGFTLKRGNAWHYRIEEQGDESNHYEDAIPVDDVIRRLFDFEVVEAPVYYLVNGEYVPSAQGRKGMLASDNNFDFGAFKDGYNGHGYKEWLISNVNLIASDELGIGSAGLLRNRGQAWVSFEVPETVTTQDGIEFRPNLTAATSFDGSMATVYKRHVQIVVCDNTRDVALAEKGQEYKIRHSKHSSLKLHDARSALQIVHSMGEDYAEELGRLVDWTVTDADFEKLLDLTVPLPEKEGRGRTMGEKKRDEIIHLYRADERASTWNGTAFGVLQAFDTWNHHYAQVRNGVPRIVRNMENSITGKYGAADADILSKLALVAA